MKIFFDYQIFQHQVYGGISRYFYELIKGIDSGYKDQIQYHLPLTSSSNQYIKNIPSLASQVKSGSDYYGNFMGSTEFPGKWRLFQLWSQLFPGQAQENQELTKAVLRNVDFDLFHPTDLDPYFLPLLKDRPFVITIHDMIDEYFPEYSFHVHSTYRTSVKAELVRKAAGIIAVSNATKKDVVERFGVDEKKIKVIYHGVGDFGSSGERSTSILPSRYFLFVGKRTHYKNFYFLLQCMQRFLQKDPSLKVVCTGAPFNAKEAEYFKDLGVENNVMHVNADDKTMANLYQYAIAFIYPSLYEGFGMPVLEAFRFGCPVLLSNTSSLPEVAGDAGVYFDPKSISSISAAIEKVWSSDSFRQDMIARGRERLKEFSWKKTVDETVAFYKTCV